VLGACWPLVMEVRKIKEEKEKCELRGRHSDCYWVEVRKEKKRRSEVKGSKSLDEEIKDDRSTRKKDHGQLSKRKNPLIGCFGAPREKEGKTGWQSPENTGQVDLGF
jgi:hypothetical protein